MAVTALLLIPGAFGLIAIGGTALGVAALALCVLLLFLWQAGM